MPGAICLPLEAIRKVLLHFANTNFVLAGDHIGQELRGVPMGDAISNAALRLYKLNRERACAACESERVY